MENLEIWGKYEVNIDFHILETRLGIFCWGHYIYMLTC